MRWSVLSTLALVASLLCSACRPEAAKIELPPPKVGVNEAIAAPVGREFRFSGRTMSPQRVEIRSQIDGTVRERFFTDGQLVRRGDKLFEIDVRSPEAALSQAQAALAQARVAAVERRNIAKRNKRLLEAAAVSKEEYDISKAEADAAQAQVKAAMANVESAALQRNFAEIVAPFDGRIGTAEIDVGSLVSPNTGRLSVIARLDPMYADFVLSERQLLNLIKRVDEDSRRADKEVEAQAVKAKKEGEASETEDEGTGDATPDERLAKVAQSGSVMRDINTQFIVALELADGSYHDYQGELVRVGVELDAKTGTFPMRAVFPNPLEKLVPGLFATVVVREAEAEPRVLVPRTALLYKQVGIIAYVVGEGQVAQERLVKLGETYGDLVVIAEGIDAGETVVSRGVHKVRDGEPVEPAAQEPLTLESDPLATPPKAGEEGWLERFNAQKRVAALTGVED